MIQDLDLGRNLAVGDITARKCSALVDDMPVNLLQYASVKTWKRAEETYWNRGSLPLSAVADNLVGSEMPLGSNERFVRDGSTASTASRGEDTSCESRGGEGKYKGEFGEHRELSTEQTKAGEEKNSLRFE